MEEEDIISEGDINKSLDSTQPTNNTTTAIRHQQLTLPVPAPVNATPDDRILTMLMEIRDSQNNLESRLTNLENKPSVASHSSPTIPTSILSPSTPTTTTTTTTLTSTPIPPRGNPTYAAAAAASTKTFTTTTHPRKPSPVELATTTTSTTNASSTTSTTTNPPSSIFTTVSSRSSTTFKGSFLKQLKSNHHLPTGTTEANPTAFIDFGTAIDLEMENLDTSVTIKITMDSNLFGGIFKLHRTELLQTDVADTLKADFNKCLLNQFDSNHTLFGAINCTDVLEVPSTSTNNDSYHITFTLAQTNTPFTTDYIDSAQQALLVALQAMELQQKILRNNGNGPSPDGISEFWINNGFSALFGAVIFDSFPLMDVTVPHQTVLVSTDLQAREFNQLDKRFQRYFIQNFIHGCGIIDYTNSFTQLANLLPLLHRHVALRAHSYPNPDYQTNTKSKQRRSKPTDKSSTKSKEKQFNAVASIVVSNTPFGNIISKALVRLLRNPFDLKLQGITIPNRSVPIHFQPIPNTDDARNNLFHTIRKQQSANTIHMMRDLPIDFNHIASIHSTHLQHHQEIVGINPSYLFKNEDGTPSSSAHVIMNTTMMAKYIEKTIIKKELIDTYNNLTNNPTVVDTTRQSTSATAVPDQVVNTNPLLPNAIYGGQVLFQAKGKYWVVFWGKGGYYITITSSYPDALQRTFEVSFNHHVMFNSQAEAFRAISEVYGGEYNCMEHIDDHNFQVPLLTTNLCTQHAPPCLRHLHKRKGSNKDLIAYPQHPATDEELVHRYKNSNQHDRQRYMASSQGKKISKCVTAIIRRIDTSVHPLSQTDINNLILSEVQPSDTFTLSEHSRISEALHNRPTQSQPQNDNTSKASSSLKLPNDDDMSLSTVADINNDNHDSNQFYVSSQEQQQDIDASNKRKHTSIAPSPLTFLTPLQISPRFRELHWCLVTDVLPFHSVLDLKNTMLNNGLYYDFCHEDNKQYLSLDSVHLGQHLDITDDDIPTHAIWICNGESGYNDVLNTLTKHGILDTHIIQTHARLQAYDSLRLLPLDNDIEDQAKLHKCASETGLL